MSRLYSRYKSRYFKYIRIFLIKTLAAAGIKNGDMIMAVHADMLQFNSSGQSNSSSRSRTSSTTGQPDFDASARQLIQSCRNDRQKRNQVWVLDFFSLYDSIQSSREGLGLTLQSAVLHLSASAFIPGRPSSSRDP